MNQKTKFSHFNGSKINSAVFNANKRSTDDINRIVSKYAAKNISSPLATDTASQSSKLKITFIGGLESVGEKNMAVIEYGQEAIVLDCGNNLSIDLPGVNYEINNTTYLQSIKHKIKAYVVTHGHLDHMGGLKHTVPSFPAPIYGSRYTIGIIEKSFEDLAGETGSDFKPQLIAANIDNHENIKICNFYIEFIRVTHSLPDATAVSIKTPIGLIVATGDFRLDPEPLDKMPTDTKRLKQLGDEGVLVLLSESSYAEASGRVQTESTLQQSFYDIIDDAEGRIFVAAFSSNINRTQMIINAAVKAGRKVALDGRGMLSYSEIAVRQGILKIPKGTIVPISMTQNIPDKNLLVMCTGGQGEPNAALQRMSEGLHKFIKLGKGDTVVISSSPIPGNEERYNQISDRLSLAGVHLYRHVTHELDQCGPLHVSGHAKRDELAEMLQLIRPKYFIPVHGGALRRKYHAELAVQNGLQRKNVALPNNGYSVYMDQASMQIEPGPNFGSLLVDQNAQIVSDLVVKDKLTLSERGIIAVTLTIDPSTNNLTSTPNIISRGFTINSKGQHGLEGLSTELHRVAKQRYGRITQVRFKEETKNFIGSFVYKATGSVPLVIVSVNTVGSSSNNAPVKPATPINKPNSTKTDQQKHFETLRANLLKK